MATVEGLIKEAQANGTIVSRRKLRMALGSRTARRAGTKHPGTTTKPRQRLQEAIEQAKAAGC